MSGCSSVRLVTLAGGAAPVVLATHGPLTLTAECGAGATTARIFVSTTEDNSAAAGNGTGSSQDFILDSGDAPTQVGDAGGMGTRAYIPITISALAPSGKGFSGEIGIYRDGSGADDICRFHGSLALQG